MGRIAHRGLRGAVACVLAYALVLQAFLFGVYGAAALGGANDAPFAFALCSHDGGGAAAPDTPAQAPDNSEHCVFCVAGAVYLNGAPPAAPHVATVAFTNAVWLLPAPRPLAFLVNESARPRGPPAAA